MTLRSLIVDDEPLARKRLRSLLRSEPRIEVVGEAEDGPGALEAIRRLDPDLVWLDVQMPGLDGFGVLDQIGPDAAPAIIFVTAHDSYAMRAFDAHAVDYLLKPFDRVRLREAIDRAIKLAGSDDLQRRLVALLADVTKHRPLRRIVVRSGGRIYFVGVHEIDWLEAAGHYVTLHAGSATHLIRDTIASLATRLDGARFVRIERGTIVNTDRIQEIHAAFHGDLDVVLKNGTRLRATRSYAERLREWLDT
jgi:two-component system, LytTR family, response regulator